MDTLTVGAIVEAVVIRLEPYGAWLDCAGRTGLVLIPEVSWSRISHPSNVLTIGQHVRVKVQRVRADGQFTASIREVHPELDPWYDPAVFAVGAKFVGPVVLVVQYGCFVELRPEVWGLLRKEQWTSPMAVGDRVRVRVDKVDAESRKVEVSLVLGAGVASMQLEEDTL